MRGYGEYLSALVEPERPLLVVRSHLTTDGRALHALVESVLTGETRPEAVVVGKETFTADVPTRTWSTIATADRVADLPATPQYDRDLDPFWTRYTEKRATDRARDSALVEASTVFASQVLASARRRGSSGVVTSSECRSCPGTGRIERDCDCTIPEMLSHVDRGGNHTEVTIEAPGPSECPICSGSGRALQRCQACRGSGTVSHYSTLVIEADDGRSADIRLDPVQLIAGGVLTVIPRVAAYSTWGEICVDLDTAELIDHLLARLGQTRQTASPTVGGHATDWMYLAHRYTWTLRYSVVTRSGSTLYAPAKDGSLATDPRTNPADAASLIPLLDPEAALDHFITDFARSTEIDGSYAEDESEGPLELARRGLAVSSEVGEWTKTITISDYVGEEDVAAQLADRAAEHGFAIGFGAAFIATGESGPAVYLASANGTPLAELAVDYLWSVAIREALQRIDAVVQHLRAIGL